VEPLEKSTPPETPAEAVRRAMITQGYNPDAATDENGAENRPGTTL